ncbi:hypothetical protein ACFL6O_04635 [candidate division KSB1 bacterium]
MMIPELFNVELFATGRYTGNQHAVFKNVEGITDDEMQNIARGEWLRG